MASRVEVVKRIRATYPKGTVLICDRMNDPRPVPSGTQGVVDFVDDIGTIHCTFDNGRHIGLIEGVDEFHIVK